MISFRYHIVSLAAVFFALGLGLLVGATVLDRVTLEGLKQNERLADARADRLRAQVKSLEQALGERDALVSALAPRLVSGTLAGTRVVFVHAGAANSWEDDVRNAIRSAGAQDDGSITFTDRWHLPRGQDADALRGIFATDLPARDPAGAAARLLGQQLTTATGPDLVGRLADAGFLAIAPAPGRSPFPAPATALVVFASSDDAYLADFARAASGGGAILVVSATPNALGTVGAVRQVNDPPPTLSTFDAAANDPSGVGTVLALRAAVDQKGGNFGRAPGLRYLPAAP